MTLLTNSLVLDTLVLCSLPLIFLFIKSIFNYRYWKNKNVFYFSPTFPFGNYGAGFLSRITFHQMHCEFYNKIKYDLKLPYGGLYQLMTPKLMVTDPELYKYILIKDFDHFVDRGMGELDAKRDPIAGHLFLSKGEYWKRLRNKLSPTFTSGKIKYMFPLIKKCSDQLITTIRKQIGESKQMSLEVKDYCARYTTDVIGTTAFGIEINSLENPDSEFRQVSLLVMKPSVLQMLKAVLSELIPLIKYLNLKIFDPRISQFFSNLVKTNLSYREKNNIKRDDFLNIMMQLQIAQRGKTLSPDDVGKSLLNFCRRQLLSPITFQNLVQRIEKKTSQVMDYVL